MAPGVCGTYDRSGQALLTAVLRMPAVTHYHAMISVAGKSAVLVAEQLLRQKVAIVPPLQRGRRCGPFAQ